MKGLLPSIFALEESSLKDGDAGSNYTDDQKPLWKCFGYDEISVATDNFHPGKKFFLSVLLLNRNLVQK